MQTLRLNKQYSYFDKGYTNLFLTNAMIDEIKCTFSTMFFYQKTLKDGDMKVTWMQYEALLVQRLNPIKCINSSFSEVLRSLIVLDLETFTLINATKECICLRFLHLTTMIHYIFSYLKNYERWYMFQCKSLMEIAGEIWYNLFGGFFHVNYIFEQNI